MSKFKEQWKKNVTHMRLDEEGNVMYSYQDPSVEENELVMAERRELDEQKTAKAVLKEIGQKMLTPKK